MDGARRLAPAQAYRASCASRRLVLNRYWDDRAKPRQESYREDVRPRATSRRPTPRCIGTCARGRKRLGFSAAGCAIRRDLTTLETTDLVPVDLNSLLYQRRAHDRRAAPGSEAQPATRGRGASSSHAANGRRQTLLAAAYDGGEGFFFDVRWRTGDRVGRSTDDGRGRAAVLRLGQPSRAARLPTRLERIFSKPGGFVTTTMASGQQWDAPNGWPPLEWIGDRGRAPIWAR